VTEDGDVGVTYYDLRTLPPAETATLPTSTWLTVSPRGGTRFGHERRIAPVFDHLQAPVARGYFLGDYQGLAASGDTFRAMFVTTNATQPENRTDVYFGSFSSPGERAAGGPSPQATAGVAPAPAVVKYPLRSRR
jgi:hypothetical protein